MKLLVAFLLISQLLYINARSPLLIVPIAPLIPIDCDNFALHVAADYTLRKVNSDLKEGYKFGLRQITYGAVQISPRTQYFIKFLIQKSDCLFGSEKSWKDCGYTNTDKTIHAHCKSNVYIHNTNTVAEVISYNCTNKSVKSSQIVPKTATPEAPTKLSHDDPEVQELLRSTVAKINSESNSPYLFAADTIYSASKKVVVVYQFKVLFSVNETGCLKNSTITPEDCPLQRDSPKKWYCNSTWLVESGKPSHTQHVSCGDEMSHILSPIKRFTLFPGMGAIRGVSLEPGPREQEVKTPIADSPPQMTDFPHHQHTGLPTPKTIICPGLPWQPLTQSSLTVPPNTQVPVNETTV